MRQAESSRDTVRLRDARSCSSCGTPSRLKTSADRSDRRPMSVIPTDFLVVTMMMTMMMMMMLYAQGLH